MAVREYYGVQGTLTAGASAASTILLVNASLSGAISATFVNGQDETYFALYTGHIYELVKVIGVNGTALTVLRAQGGTVAQAFPIGSMLSYEVTSQAIIAQVGVVANDVQITGSGLFHVQELSPNVFVGSVEEPRFVGSGGISILGTYPDLQFVYTAPQDDCCGGSGSGSTGEGITELVGEGLVLAFVNGNVGTIKVTPPVFTAGAGIAISGAWPNYQFSATAGSGTVSSVAVGAGLTLTGAPTVNPTISITNTGVVPGTYGGVGINAQGQITMVPVGFNPISNLVAGPGLTAVRTGATVTLTPVVAAIGVPGIFPLTDDTDPFDPMDVTTVTTPKAVAKALETLVTTSVAGASSYTGEPSSEYTNSVGASNTPLILLPGETALVLAAVTAVDGTTPLTPVAFGMAIFDGIAALVKGNRKITQNNQSIAFIVTGPINTSYTIATTALPAGSTVQSHSLSVIKF